jgi:hypothetical protein
MSGEFKFVISKYAGTWGHCCKEGWVSTAFRGMSDKDRPVFEMAGEEGLFRFSSAPARKDLEGYIRDGGTFPAEVTLRCGGRQALDGIVLHSAPELSGTKRMRWVYGAAGNNKVNLVHCDYIRPIVVDGPQPD